MKYYILYRNYDSEIQYEIVSCVEGANPLYGHGSWNLYSSKAYETWEAAYENIP